MGKNRHHFNKYGQPKKAYTSHHYAAKVRNRVMAETGWMYQTYKCTVCGQFHIGGKEYWRVRRSQVKHEEMLIGKLVHALRLNLDR